MAVLNDCMTDIKNQIDALSLSDLGDNNVVIRKAPWDLERNRIHTGITVHLPLQEHELPGTNSCDDIVYPIMVTVIRGTGGSELDNMARLGTWRQKIRREFINQRLSTVVSVYTCRIKFGRVLLPKQYRDNYDATTMAILCVSRETRGN
ncbi:hypothetical protein CMI37_31695 [Candidatus Pacearchaeota archaeon]|nr:hypothetical protein [Candidatus Pacearchaeota archaeon]|tara:strand:- start:2845 stop:3291 length:447 start_codon:yes stop_codon:yes gene_type:complete